MHIVGGALVAALAWAAPASATVNIRFSPALATIPAVGQTTTVDIVADADAPIVAWGFDLAVFNAAIANPIGGLVYGPGWFQVGTVDGDDLAGTAFPVGQTGNGIVLATLTFIGNQLGATPIELSYTPSDETEGVGYELGGLADVVFTPGAVQVLPEPASLALLALGALVLRRRGN
jgi:hypothetical protein